jgi:hypothetical protein
MSTLLMQLLANLTVKSDTKDDLTCRHIIGTDAIGRLVSLVYRQDVSRVLCLEVDHQIVYDSYLDREGQLEYRLRMHHIIG